MLLTVLFWAQLALAVGNALLLRAWIRRRRWGQAAISTVCMVFSALMAAIVWGLEGPCLLPHPGLIPYEAGMTLCPGQSTLISLPVPLPPAERAL